MSAWGGYSISTICLRFMVLCSRSMIDVWF